MKCSQIKTKFSGYLSGEIDELSRQAIQEHVTECSSCREELESLSAVWTKMGVLPEEQPGSDLRPRFYAMLEEYKQREGHKRTGSVLGRFLGNRSGHRSLGQTVLQLPFALMLLIVGIAAGYFLHASLSRGGEIAQLRREIQQVRQIASVSLLRQESLTEQLRGVGLTPRAERLDRETLDALLRLISYDAGLSSYSETLRSPFPFGGYPVLDQEFVNILSEQASPLVEVALSLMGPRF